MDDGVKNSINLVGQEGSTRFMVVAGIGLAVTVHQL
jgi:hypothetical protein